MVLAFFLTPALLSATRALTIAGGRIGASSAGKAFSKFSGTPLGFGAQYSLGTYLGFPGNYQSRQGSNTTKSYNLQMPYGRSYGRRNYYNRYSSRYPRRFGRRYSNRRYSYGRRYY